MTVVMSDKKKTGKKNADDVPLNGERRRSIAQV